jgi:hypothetical protein
MCPSVNLCLDSVAQVDAELLREEDIGMIV